MRLEATISNFVKIMLAKTWAREDYIEIPSICSYNWFLKEKVILLQQSKISFFKVRSVSVLLMSFLF